MAELSQAEDIKQLTEKVQEQNYYFNLLKQEINKAIIGQEYMVDRLLIGLLGNGHILLEVFYYLLSGFFVIAVVKN